MKVKDGQRKIIVVFFISVSIFFSFAAYHFSVKKLERRPNIILISVDGLRADHLTCYGYRRNTSPNICNFAEDGVIFDKAFSPGTATPVSYPSLITGLYPPAFRGSFGLNETFGEGQRHLVNVLEKKGYFTKMGGFPFVQRLLNRNFTKSEGIASFSVPKRKKFLMIFHSMGVHFPYCQEYSQEYCGLYSNEKAQVNETYWYNFLRNKRWRKENITFPNRVIKLFKNRYDGAIKSLDSRIGTFIENLKEEGIYKDSLIVITSDHGEGFGEHESVFHGGPPYDEAIHVPLIIKFPKNKWKGKRVKQLSRIVDIAPTVYSILGISPYETHGTSLTPTIKGQELNLSCFIRGGDPLKGIMWRGIRSERYKYLEADGHEKLYDLKIDPDESNNLAKERVKVKERLRKRFLEMYQNITGRTYLQEEELEEKTKERLRKLGYLND